MLSDNNQGGGIAASPFPGCVCRLDKTFTLVDKNKALRWIEALRPHVGTTISSEELDDAAKIIQDTEKKQGLGQF